MLFLRAWTIEIYIGKTKLFGIFTCVVLFNNLCSKYILAVFKNLQYFNFSIRVYFWLENELENYYDRGRIQDLFLLQYIPHYADIFLHN